MLLAIDIGNTNVVLGIFKEDLLVTSYRLSTDTNRTVDEYALQLKSLLELDDLPKTEVSRAVISSVVPALTRVFAKLSRKYFGCEPLVVDALGIPDVEVRYNPPQAVGSDRLVNAYAARRLVGAPAVVVDFGTATTFDVISKDGAYEGGVIAPGLLLAYQLLGRKAALLPEVELRIPSVVIGKNTEDAMVSGLVFGYTALIDGIVEQIRAELDYEVSHIVATGGLAGIIGSRCKSVTVSMPDLTLQGLRLVANSHQAISKLSPQALNL